MESEAIDIDLLESLLQRHVDDLTMLTGAVVNGDDVDKIASDMAARKHDMIGLVQNLAFLDKQESDLMADLKAWEHLAKQAIDRHRKVDQSIEGIEASIKQAINDLQSEEKHENY